MPLPGATCADSGVYLSDCRCNAVLFISKGQLFPHCCGRSGGLPNWTFHRRDINFGFAMSGDRPDPKRKR